MHILVQLLPELILLAVVAGALQLVVLAFRNPFRAAWLRGDGAAIACALAITVVISVSLGVVISGATAAGLDLLGALLLTFVGGVGSGYAVWRAFGVGERLRRADAGQSPFYPSGKPRLLMRGFRRQFGGGAGP